METRRKTYLDILRIIAAFAVVMVHTSCRYFNQSIHNTTIDSSEWFFANIYDSLSRFCVPVFLMISGALFLSKDITIKKIWTKYIPRLLLVFFFWSALFDIIALQEKDLFNIVSYTLTGMSRFNFLLIMVALYSICPILRLLVKYPKMLDYFLKINLAYLIIVTTFFSNIRSYISSPKLYSLVDNLMTWINRIPFNFISWSILYFVIGYVIDQIIISRRTRVLIYCGGMIGTIFTIVMTYSDSIKKLAGEFQWMNYNTLNVFLQSVAVFIAIRRIKIEISEKGRRILEYLSKCTLGVYVIHSYILDYFLPNNLKIDVFSLPAAIAVPCISLVVFTICMFLSATLNSIPGIKHLL